MAENESEKTHVMMQECIISELGRCTAGHMLSETDVHSGTWEWLQRNKFLKSVADIEAEADSEPVTSPSISVDLGTIQLSPAWDDGKPPEVPGASHDEGQPIELLTRVKVILSEGHHRKSAIAEALACDESMLDSLLTEANGIETKGGGWYSLTPAS